LKNRQLHLKKTLGTFVKTVSTLEKTLSTLGKTVSTFVKGHQHASAGKLANTQKKPAGNARQVSILSSMLKL
jgi:hypothetical protein